jgi:hypothetical protein
VHGADSPVVPVRVDVRREEDGARERGKLDGAGKRENDAEPSASGAKRIEADEVGGEGCGGRSEVEPGPSAIVTLVVGNERRALRVGKREGGADESKAADAGRNRSLRGAGRFC